MQKPAELTNPYAANDHLFGAAVQFNKVYLPLLSSRALAGIAAQQINAIRWLAYLFTQIAALSWNGEPLSAFHVRRTLVPRHD